MITILKNNIPNRHVNCPKDMYDYQCLENETWVEGVLEIPSDTSYLGESWYKVHIINKEYEDAVRNLTIDTPDSEKQTWLKQENEARAYISDNTTSTPLIDAMCEARNCTKEYMVNKIIEKADAYAVAIGRLTGIRQAKEKLITQGEE